MTRRVSHLTYWEECRLLRLKDTTPLAALFPLFLPNLQEVWTKQPRLFVRGQPISPSIDMTVRRERAGVD